MNINKLFYHQDIAKLEQSYQGKENFAECEEEARKQWIFFHVACTKWPKEKDHMVAEWKRNIMKSIFFWVSKSNTNVYDKKIFFD